VSRESEAGGAGNELFDIDSVRDALELVGVALEVFGAAIKAVGILIAAVCFLRSEKQHPGKSVY
jgi:hypothetical protein